MILLILRRYIRKGGFMKKWYIRIHTVNKIYDVSIQSDDENIEQTEGFLKHNIKCNDFIKFETEFDNPPIFIVSKYITAFEVQDHPFSCIYI